MVFVVHTRNLKGSSAPRGCVAFVCVAAQVIEVGNHGAGTCSINVVLRFLWKADGRALPSCSHSEADL